MRILGLLLLLITHPSSASTCSDQFQNILTSIHGTSEIDEGQALVEKIKANTLKESAEHKINIQEYMKAIDQIALRDPEFKKITEMFEKREFTFAVDQSSEGRLGILKKGILNQYETKSSGGVLAPDKRNFVEARYLRMEPAQYKKLPKQIKPKSMYLVPDLNSKIKLAPTHYIESGSPAVRTGDTWILDLNKIEKNTVFVTGDSLDRGIIEGDLYDDIKQLDINPKSTLDGTHVVDYLLPLDWLKTTVPFYYEQVKSENLFRFVDPKVFKDYYKAQIKTHGHFPQWQEIIHNSSRPEFNKAFFKKFPELKKFEDDQLLLPYGNYSEGLYFGKLPPQKIKALIYHERPPSEKEMKELKKLGIQVIDGRNSNQ